MFLQSGGGWEKGSEIFLRLFEVLKIKVAAMRLQASVIMSSFVEAPFLLFLCWGKESYAISH